MGREKSGEDMAMTRNEVRQRLKARNDAIAAGRLVPPPYVGSDFTKRDPFESVHTRGPKRRLDDAISG